MNLTLLIIVGYAVFVYAMSFAARSYRSKVATLRGAIIASGGLNDFEEALLDRVLPRSYSWRSSILIAFSYGQGLFMSAGQLARECSDFDHRFPTLTNDPRFWAMTELENSCAYSVNPIFGIFAIAARLLFMAKIRMTSGLRANAKAFDLRSLAAT